MEVFEATHHRGRWKRQSGGNGNGPKAVPAPQSGTGIQDEVKQEINYVAQKMGVQTYHVVLIIIIIFIAIVGLCGWCVYRFFRKKRRGKDGKGGDADLAADEAALVDKDKKAGEGDKDKDKKTEEKKK